MSGQRARRRGPVPGIRFERPHWDEGLIVAGVDEVGRGAWAGPVTVGAVILPPERRVRGLRDSKLLPPPERERLSRRLHAVADGIGLGHADNDEVDGVGLSEALRRAARRALDALPRRPDVVLLDGNWDFLAGYGTRNETLVKGDARCASIAAASIVAKVARDGLMVRHDADHAAYAFAANKGYPTPDHLAALAVHGPCLLHRRSWAPIAALLQPALFGRDEGIGDSGRSGRVRPGRRWLGHGVLDAGQGPHVLEGPDDDEGAADDLVPFDEAERPA